MFYLIDLQTSHSADINTSSNKDLCCFNLWFIPSLAEVLILSLDIALNPVDFHIIHTFQEFQTIYDFNQTAHCFM